MGKMLVVIIITLSSSGPQCVVCRMQSYRSATLPNRKYGGRVAQKKAIFESLSSVSTSSIEFSTAPSLRSADFSDRKTPFSFTPGGYKTMIDRNTQTEMDLGLEKVGFNVLTWPTLLVILQVVKLFLALKNKSSELKSLTGDGRLDLMDILLEFTKVVKEMKNSSEMKNRSETEKFERAENSNLRTKTRKFLSEKASLFCKNSSPKPFGSAATVLPGRTRFQVCDRNLRRMSYSEYRELLDRYAMDRNWSRGIFKT